MLDKELPLNGTVEGEFFALFTQSIKVRMGKVWSR